MATFIQKIDALVKDHLKIFVESIVEKYHVDKGELEELLTTTFSMAVVKKKVTKKKTKAVSTPAVNEPAPVVAPEAPSVAPEAPVADEADPPLPKKKKVTISLNKVIKKYVHVDSKLVFKSKKEVGIT